jgi:membrane fusion protein (multidrug efflux system)
MPWGPGGGPGATSAVPVEVATVTRRPISSYIETNGTLEAENEVDVVARTSGPIIELAVEEGDKVRRDQTLARIDEREYAVQLEIARVSLNETRLAFERAQELQQNQLISPESYEQALASYEAAKAQYEASRILLDYTHITAPFDGLIITRYVKLAEQVSTNNPLYRISDFDPLLCPIQIPERELPRLRVGQNAYLTVEPWPGERFEARVLRISPVVNSSTGTIKVTLEARSRSKLRPGMFARVFVETATRADAVVIPKAALSLESIGDTVYVADGEAASRREVDLGFAEGDFVEIVSGVSENEMVVVVGQDGLSDGTPIRILQSGLTQPVSETRTAEAAAPAPPGRPPGGKGRGGRRFDPSTMTPEQLERAKEFMRARGMTEEQIEERIRQAREQSESASQ